MTLVWAQGLLGWGRGELEEDRGIQSWNTKGWIKFRVGNRHPTSLCKALWHIRVSEASNKAGIPGFLVLFPRAGHPCAEHQRVTWRDKSGGDTLQLPSRCTLGCQSPEWTPLTLGPAGIWLHRGEPWMPNPALLTVQRNNNHCNATADTIYT